MPQSPTCHDVRRGVIVVHAFGQYREAQFLDDPVLIDTLIADGHSWRMMDAVLLTTDPLPGPPPGAVSGSGAVSG